MKVSDWLPIETAPKDGTTIILYRPTGEVVATGRYDDNRFAKKPRPYWEDIRHYLGVTWMRDHIPTHWMPLPSPPDALPASTLAKEQEHSDAL